MVKAAASGPPASATLWRKTLVQRYWRPGDAIDQDETEFFLKGPNDEVFEPRWIYRPEGPPVRAKSAPPAKNTAPDSPKPAGS